MVINDKNRAIDIRSTHAATIEGQQDNASQPLLITFVTW
jgi:hypothetical protein